jgi:hypothetical protein
VGHDLPLGTHTGHAKGAAGSMPGTWPLGVGEEAWYPHSCQTTSSATGQVAASQIGIRDSIASLRSKAKTPSGPL